jgi:hypothetical protein
MFLKRSAQVLLQAALEHLFMVHTGDAFIDEHFIFASPFVVFILNGS